MHAAKLDRELHEAEVKFANAQAENDFYMASLQALTIFKSRSERALLDTQSRADSAHREAQETRARYEKVLPCTRCALHAVLCMLYSACCAPLRRATWPWCRRADALLLPRRRGRRLPVQCCVSAGRLPAPCCHSDAPVCSQHGSIWLRSTARVTARVSLQMYTNARAQASTAQDLQKHITDAMATKAEWESKVAVLQQELQALANATPELLEQLQYEVEELRGAVSVAEAEKRAFEQQTAGLRASKAQLQERVAAVQGELKTAQARASLHTCSACPPAALDACHACVLTARACRRRWKTL
jgi:hypothetical protein